VRSSKGEPRVACRSNTQDIIEKPKGKKKVMLNVRLQKQKTKIKIQQKGKNVLCIASHHQHISISLLLPFYISSSLPYLFNLK
jgi:hypothetical protein